MKLKTAIKYKLSVQWRSMLIYLGFFLLFAVIFPLIPVLFSDNFSNIHADLLFSAMIYLMIIGTTSIGQDFKLFIQCGTSRFHIFVANIITNLILTLGLSIVMQILRWLFNDNLIPHYHLQYSLLTAITGGDFLQTMALLWVFLILATSVGMMTGAVLTRFHGYVRLAIGAVLLGVVVLGRILFQLLSAGAKEAFIDFLKTVIGLSANGLNVWQFTAFILGVGLILWAVLYGLNRSQEVKRINA